MKYALVITEYASAALAAIGDDDWHALFVLACLDLPVDPHAGALIRDEGAVCTRSVVLGSGMIVYEVDESRATVTVVDVLWLG